MFAFNLGGKKNPVWLGKAKIKIKMGSIGSKILDYCRYLTTQNILFFSFEQCFNKLTTAQ